LTTAIHDIRLAAGFEIQPGSYSRRTIDRLQAERLAEALAKDLARTVDQADQGMLVAAGAAFEPHELLRPGLPAWSALADAAEPLIRQSGLSPSLLAIGTHQGQLPDQRLTPPNPTVQGQFVVIPLLLVVTEELGISLESQLERELFERGSIDPPARALLSEALGMESTHGQLLTANDLLALQHVQMDTAGLSGLWPVVEHVLLAPDEAMDFDLAAGLQATWQPEHNQLVLPFLGLIDFGQRDIRDYGLWLRAARTLITLCDSHGIVWRAEVAAGCELDLDGRLVRQDVGKTHEPNSAAQHLDDEFGLVAWSVADSGQLKHIYPLDAGTANQVNRTMHQQFPGLETRTFDELKP
jgi:hypothetical protein